MAGRKLISNATPCALRVTLIVRSGFDCGSHAGEQAVKVGTFLSSHALVTYGSATDNYLNGILVEAENCDGVAPLRVMVDGPGSEADRTLNTHNAIEIWMLDSVLHVTGRQVNY